MVIQQYNNPLHNLTLQKIVEELVDHYGSDKLAQRVNINCFKSDPSVKSSLKLLRKTPWAKAEVENFHLMSFTKNEENLPSHSFMAKLEQI